MIAWIDTILQGVLLGGLYALFAMGLSLMFGVMRLVNIAHGDFILLAAFGGMALVSGSRDLAGCRVARADSARLRIRLRPAARGAQLRAWARHSAAAADHLRSVDRDPERVAADLLRGYALDPGRGCRDRKLASGRAARGRLAAAHDLRFGDRGQRLRCSGCSAPRASDVHSAPRPTTARPRNSWA